MVTTNMKKFIGSIKRNSTARSKSDDRRSNNGILQQPQLPQGDNPEAIVVREAVAFCEAGAPGSAGAGDEYLHLPAIVDAAESSPHAAREVAVTIQRYLSKQNFERGYAQYNSIMLLRILTDNPGRIFTQNFDKNFIATVKTLLRECKDSSVQQIIRETLDYIEAEKLNANDTLMPLVEMWRKEKGGSARMYSSSARTHNGAAPHIPRESRPPRGLPPPDELAARIEEARTSARLLVQMVQSTPPNEMLGNELIKEFAERAKQAQKSIQQYMACETPPPDEHTMLTLIETSDQLNISMSKHQRAMLQARKAAGLAAGSPLPQANVQDPFSTTSMQNALPPQQAPRLQQQEPTRYNQYESNNLPSLQPPQLQQQEPTRQNRYESNNLYNNAATTISPIEEHEHSYIPPVGPPPTRRQELPSSTVPPSTTQPQYSSYQQEDPVSPPRTHERHNSATIDYGVAENPFADDNAYTAPSGPPPQQHPQVQSQTQPQAIPESNSYSLFNRAAGQLRSPGSPARPSPGDRLTTAELDAASYPVPPPQSNRYSEGSRPGHSSGWQPTPSFMHRQESSEAHITMSGASPERR